MRIGVYMTTLPEHGRKIGGVEMFAHRLANSLADRGHDVFVYTFAGKRPDGAKYHLRRVGRAALMRSRTGRLAVCPAVLNRIDASDLDVLNLHGDDWLYLRRTCPTVRSFHGSALNEARSATRWQRRFLQGAVLYPAEMLASRLATASYTVCMGMPHGYRLDGMLPQGGGLFPDPADEASPAPPFPDPTVLFVGTWEGRKRGRMLRDVFEAEVLPRHPTARLLMVSDRCEESEHVRWFPGPDDHSLSMLYARSWLFCLPSTYEGFGQPYVEAMAHRTPVVATHNLGVDYITDGGRTGAIVDDSELGRALVDLLFDANRRDTLANRGRRRALDFGWEKACEAHERAFRAAAAAWHA